MHPKRGNNTRLAAQGYLTSHCFSESIYAAYSPASRYRHFGSSKIYLATKLKSKSITDKLSFECTVTHLCIQNVIYRLKYIQNAGFGICFDVNRNTILNFDLNLWEKSSFRPMFKRKLKSDCNLVLKGSLNLAFSPRPEHGTKVGARSSPDHLHTVMRGR